MSLVEGYAALVVDMDGVVVHDDEVIPAAARFLRRAHRRGLPVVYVTNNSTRTAGAWADLLAAGEIPVTPDRIVTSAVATAEVLAADPPPRCLVIGEDGLRTALRAVDAELVSEPGRADVVVVGADHGLTYARLRDATRAVAAGARLVGTNPDLVRPGRDGPWPGTGATLAFLEATTGVTPDVVGKPDRRLLDMAARRLPDEGPVLVAGDQITTDVGAAAAKGWDAALVLTGVDDWSALVGAPVTPTWVIGDLADLDEPAPPSVRPARPADLSSLRRLPGEGRGSAGPPGPETPDPEPGETLVAVGADGEVVGAVSWEVEDTTARLDGLRLTADQQGGPTGTHLVARCLEVLRRRGVIRVVAPGRTATTGLAALEDLGFSHADGDTDRGAGAEGGDLVRRLGAGGS